MLDAAPKNAPPAGAGTQEFLTQEFSILRELLKTRRAVRIFDGSPVPEEVMKACLKLGLESPSSSNLQPWEFYWVRDPNLRAPINQAFINQSAARTASEIVVAVARTATWRRNRERIIELLKAHGPRVAPANLRYYEVTVKNVYDQGRFGLRGLLKRVVNSIFGWRRAINREPSSHGQMKLWAVKSTSLACQTIFLAFRSLGYDTCPMEGMDSKRLRRLLNLPADAIPVMGIAVGKRAAHGLSSPRVRLPTDLFLKEV